MSNEESRGRVSLAVGQSDAKVQCGSSFEEFQWQRRGLWFWHMVMGREGVKLGSQEASHTVEKGLHFIPRAIWSYSVQEEKWHRDIFGCWLGNGLDVGRDREKEEGHAIAVPQVRQCSCLVWGSSTGDEEKWIYLRYIMEVGNTGLQDALEAADKKKGVIKNDFQAVVFSFFWIEQMGAWWYCLQP